MDGQSKSGYNGHMRHRVGIRQLRDSLSRWIERVKRGDEVVVTDHGKPVARLAPCRPTAGRRKETEEEWIARLKAEGRLLGGSGILPPLEPIITADIDLAEAVLKDREERDRMVAGEGP